MTCSYCRTLNALSSITQSDNRGEAKFNDFGFSSGVQLTSVDINELCFLTSANPAEVQVSDGGTSRTEKNKKNVENLVKKHRLQLSLSSGLFIWLEAAGVFSSSCFSLERKHSRLRGNTPTRLGRKSTSNPAILSDLKPLTWAPRAVLQQRKHGGGAALLASPPLQEVPREFPQLCDSN